MDDGSSSTQQGGCKTATLTSFPPPVSPQLSHSLRSLCSRSPARNPLPHPPRAGVALSPLASSTRPRPCRPPRRRRPRPRRPPRCRRPPRPLPPRPRSGGFERSGLEHRRPPRLLHAAGGPRSLSKSTRSRSSSMTATGCGGGLARQTGSDRALRVEVARSRLATAAWSTPLVVCFPFSPLLLPLIHGHRLASLESDDRGAPGR